MIGSFSKYGKDSTLYRISDVNDLINGYFFNTKLFDNTGRPDLTQRQVEIHSQLFEIKRGFKKRFHHIAVSQNYHAPSPSYSIEAETGKESDGEFPVQIQFPVSTIICASFCGQEADVCFELTKIEAV